MTWRDGPVPPTSILVIVDGHEGTQSGIAVLSGLVAGTLSRVSIAGDARTVAPVIEAVGRGERVPVSVERWQIVAGPCRRTRPIRRSPRLTTAPDSAFPRQPGAVLCPGQQIRASDRFLTSMGQAVTWGSQPCRTRNRNLQTTLMRDSARFVRTVGVLDEHS